MIKLFEVGESNMATLNKEWISMIPEFKRLLTRDKGTGKYKTEAQRDFTYIFLRYDFMSPFENYKETDREVEALKCSGMERGKMEADGDLWDAIRMYQRLQNESSVALQTYRDLKTSVEDLREYIRDMNLHERTETGAKVHSPKEKQDAINGMPKTILTLQEMENTVRAELEGNTGLRGDATKGQDEDPDDY